jgi:predicted TIM-barrel fold metal-dependent hydrolase
MTQVTTNSASIRDRLTHPVIDADGHYIDLPSVFASYVRDHGRGDLVERPSANVYRNRRVGFWVAPGETRYWATVSVPGLYYERLAEAGIDFAVLYPTRALVLIHTDDDECRIELCRLYNDHLVEDFGAYFDRFAPAALIPMHTPDEAVAELEHVASIGLKVGLIPSYVARPSTQTSTSIWGSPRRLDTYGIDSDHDYDPVWQKATELGMALACHSQAMGFTDRASPTNYMYDHIGHFAAAGEAVAKSLFFGGVTRRFPALRVALLEGGVAGGVRLYGDLVARWRKRGAQAIQRLNPANLDLDELDGIYQSRGGRIAGFTARQLVAEYGDPSEGRDDFELAGIRSIEDIRDRFCANFYWGCEADDPLVGVAFDPRINPLGARVPAVFSSDIGHWDVPEFDSPLAEAYELLEEGILDENQFRDFTFTNQVHLYADLNPGFFAGTAVEREAAAVLSST